MTDALPSRLPFVKMHGLGNDFVVVDIRSCPVFSDVLGAPQRVRFLCDRHRGIGADGVLVVSEGQTVGAMAAMTVYNADGSLSQMCGNGLRCVALYAANQAPECHSPSEASAVFAIDTGAGPKTCKVRRSRLAREASVEVEMGPPSVLQTQEVDLEVSSQAFLGALTIVSMGNPHAVCFCDDAHDFSDLLRAARTWGPGLETHPLFPEKTNVEFVRVAHSSQAPDSLEVVVWERGCGLTLACGTGACAAAAAALQQGLLPNAGQVRVRLPGGVLSVTVAPDFSSSRLVGPAETVFFGEIATSSIMALDGSCL